MSDHVTVGLRDRVQSITLTRTAKKNALTRAMYGAMADALAAGEASDEVRVHLITGADGVFTAGNDLTDFMNVAAGFDDVTRFLRALSTLTKPLVIAVDGAAVGIGVTMLLHADLVYASGRSAFRTPFVDLGLVPEAASSLLMPARMGHARAADMLLLGETLSAAQAEAAGLLTAVVPPAELSAFAHERAARLARKAPAAVRATKALLRDPHREVIASTMAAEAEIFLERLRSPELQEAATAFFQRREPDFSASV